jgi:hypothetical protein
MLTSAFDVRKPPQRLVFLPACRENGRSCVALFPSTIGSRNPKPV